VKIRMQCDGMLSALERHLKLEGDELVERGEEAELIVRERGHGALEGPGLVVGSDVEITHPALLRALGFPYRGSDSTYALTKYWHGEWHPSTLFSVGAVGVMDDGMGAQVPTGIVGRFVSGGDIDRLFERKELEALLRRESFTGPVTLGMHDGFVSAVNLRLNPVIFALGECREGKLSELLRTGGPIGEKWVIAAVVSRWPWPAREAEGRAELLGLESEEHFWGFRLNCFRDSRWTTESILGIATAKGEKLSDANARLWSLVRTIGVAEKQVRRDWVQIGGSAWRRARESLIVS